LSFTSSSSYPSKKSFLFSLLLYYLFQQLGDAKKPYFAQYSAVVWEDAPVKAS
jgi:hypothetical protein